MIIKDFEHHPSEKDEARIAQAEHMDGFNAKRVVIVGGDFQMPPINFPDSMKVTNEFNFAPETQAIVAKLNEIQTAIENGRQTTIEIPKREIEYVEIPVKEVNFAPLLDKLDEISSNIQKSSANAVNKTVEVEKPIYITNEIVKVVEIEKPIYIKEQIVHPVEVIREVVITKLEPFSTFFKVCIALQTLAALGYLLIKLFKS